MKTNYLFSIGFFIMVFSLSGQTAQQNFINYQGVARAADGALLAESRLDLGIGLRFGSENAVLAYQEIHAIDTDANGVFSIRIGTGTVTTGDYNTLPWGSAAAFITTSINGTAVGTTEIMAVPYAISSGDGQQTAAQVPYDNTTSGLLASNAQEAIDALVSSGGSGTDDQNLELTDDVLTIEGGAGSVDLSNYVDDADADPANELQTLSFDVGTNELSLSNGNTVTIPSGGTDADADPTNELQTLSFDVGTNELSLSNGNTVTIPSGGTDADADPTNELQDISLDGTEISITDGSTIDLAPIIPPGGTDNQNLELTGDVLSIEDGTGSVDLSNYVDDADADPANELQMLSFDVGTNELSLSDGNSVTLPTGGTDTSPWQANGTNDIFYNAGNVGIGLINPRAALHVHQDAAQSNSLYTTTDTGDGPNNGLFVGLVNRLGDGFTGEITNQENGGLYLGTNGLDRIRIMPDGQVSIGSIFPQEALDVEGTIRSRDLAGTGLRNVVADADGNLVIGAGGADGDSDPTNEIQDISLDGAILSISSGSSIDLEPLLPPGGSDDQNLELTGDVLSIEGGIGSVDLSLYRDDDDADVNNEIQDISLDGTEISISSGSTIDLAPLIPPGGSDDQNLELTGDVLSIEGGIGSVDLSAYINDADFDPLNEVDVTGQTGILLGDGTDVTGLVGTTDGQVPKWDAASSAWVPGEDETGTGGGGAEELNDLSDAIADTALESLFLGANSGINNIGDLNTAIGQNTLTLNTTGRSNTAVGFSSLTTNTTGVANTALGVSTLRNHTEGNLNTAIGSVALRANTTGEANTALGSSALFNNTTGNSNTAVGVGSLISNTTGRYNIAIGTSALNFNTTGEYNIAVGIGSLYNNVDGDNNTALGRDALRNSTISNLTAVGFEALKENTTGTENTAVGSSALTANTTGAVNTAVGELALFSNSTGQRNTALGASTLANNTTASGNTAIGARALSQNTAQWNTAVGSLALTFNTTGVNNTAIGRSVLSNNTEGIQNTAVGTNALTANISGGNNTAIGAIALSRNTTGSRNAAFGAGALFLNVSGANNSAIGTQALRSNTTGFENTAVGYDALFTNTTGIRNTAVGGAALTNNTNGENNTGVGRSALFENTTGDNNTALGLAALLSNTTGSFNTALGYNAMRNLVTGNNNTAIGENAQVPFSTGSNQVRIGNTNISLAQIQVPWTFTSDRRWKTDIKDLPYGLNLVNQLRPVDYRRKNNNGLTRETGFIAQEVEEVLQRLGYKNQGILTKDDNGYMSLRYNDFVPVLTKAIQEQHTQIQDLQEQNEAMLAQMNRIQKQLTQLLASTSESKTKKKSNQNTKK
ncbi:MAG: tail fiber domain-containing protein [Bacteroidota bacterium]